MGQYPQTHTPPLVRVLLLEVCHRLHVFSTDQTEPCAYFQRGVAGRHHQGPSAMISVAWKSSLAVWTA